MGSVSDQFDVTLIARDCSLTLAEYYLSETAIIIIVFYFCLFKINVTMGE